jgi:protein TonB
VLDVFSEYDELRKKKYSVEIDIWVSPDGTVTRYELARGSNDPEIDKLLNKLLTKFKKSEAPPPGIEQPINLKFNSRL